MAFLFLNTVCQGRHLGILTVVVKQLMLRSLKRAGVDGQLAAIYSTFIPLEIVHMQIWVAATGASSDCALVVVPCASSHMVLTFRGRRKGNLVFWWSKVNFS